MQDIFLESNRMPQNIVYMNIACSEVNDSLNTLNMNNSIDSEVTGSISFDSFACSVYNMASDV